MFAWPDMKVDHDPVFIPGRVTMKPDRIPADRIFNDRAEIAGCVEQGDHKSDRAAKIGGIEYGRAYDAPVDAGDGDNLDPKAIVELVGQAGCEVLLVGRLNVTLYFYIDGIDKRPMERIFARHSAGEERK